MHELLFLGGISVSNLKKGPQKGTEKGTEKDQSQFNGIEFVLAPFQSFFELAYDNATQ